MQETIIIMIIIGFIFFIAYHYIKNLYKTEKQFNEDATNMVVFYSGYGKAFCLEDLKNGYVILDHQQTPVSKKYIKPIYF